MKRTPITFEVPRRLRPPSSTRITAAIVRGVLKRDGGRLDVCDVTDIKPVTGDLDRLERGLASLPAKDFETRKAWARWAERRAKEFKDNALCDRARAIEGDALRIESEMKRLGVDAPREWLAMAQEARRRQVPEPEPSALGPPCAQGQARRRDHRRRLDSGDRGDQGVFPESRRRQASGRVNLAEWEGPYADDPAGDLSHGPAPVREALDRRLWADATARLLELEAVQDLPSALAAAEQAASTLPEKTTLPAQLIEKAAPPPARTSGTCG